MNYELIRTDVEDERFVRLVSSLDQDLAKRDGDDHSFYAQFNKMDPAMRPIICLVDEVPVGCGAFKPFDDDSVEIKRMYVEPESRGKGIGGLVLKELEGWAVEQGYSSSVLETGLKQPEAIGLYKKSGYEKTENFGQYKGVENSVCMRKNF